MKLKNDNLELFNLRKVYVDELINLASRDSNIVILDSDSKEPLLLDSFSNIYPDRSFTFGIAEQDMVSAAGGMSTFGLIPFVNSYGMFIAMRALDQVRNAIAYPNLNVKFVISHHGLDAGSDGITHQLTEDIGIFRTIPNIKLLQPADRIEMTQMIQYAATEYGPMVIKAGKSKVQDVHDIDYVWRYGVPSLIYTGEDIAIVTNGIMLKQAILARETLIEMNSIHPTVINMSTLTDINIDLFLQMLDNINYVITLEDHSIYGGIGSIVSEILSENKPTKITRLGLNGTFAECGAPDLLFEKYKMDAGALIQTILGD